MSTNQSTYPVYIPGDLLDQVQSSATKAGLTKSGFVSQALSNAVAFVENGANLTENTSGRSESLYAAFSKLLDTVLSEDTGAEQSDIPDSTFLYLIKLQTDLSRGLWIRNPEALAMIRLMRSNPYPCERFVKLLTKQLEANGVK